MLKRFVTGLAYFAVAIVAVIIALYVGQQLGYVSGLPF